MNLETPIENKENTNKIQLLEEKDKNNTEMGQMLSSRNKEQILEEKDKNNTEMGQMLSNRNIEKSNDNLNEDYVDLLQENIEEFKSEKNIKKHFFTSAVVDNPDKRHTFKENLSALKYSKIDLSSNLFDSFLDIESSCSEHGNEIQNEGENIYLSNIYGLFITLNEKIDQIVIKESNNESSKEKMKEIFGKIFFLLNNKRVSEAKVMLKDLFLILFGNFENIEEFLSSGKEYSQVFLNERIKPLIKILNESKNSLKELSGYISDKFMEMKGSFIEEREKFKFEAKESLSKEKQTRKIFEMEIRKFLQKEFELNEKNVFESLKILKETILNLKNTKKNEETKDLKLKERNLILENEISNLKNEKSIFDRKNEELNKRLAFLESEITKIQNENVSLSESLNKYTEKSIKLKKEYVVLSNEIINHRESNKKKNSVIEKQKKIIDILQSKISGKKDENDFVFPISDIKKNIEKLHDDLNNETDEEKRKKIQKEIHNFEKRLKDFLNFKKETKPR
ncbi:hypothetical protein CWI38_0036p0030 [Hamiltosporidium tvaerminnensis]|uniref:Uncharacterized protein n=1 Tax=Hamiltosporidium tvaerminnensis TaxID=1176355 RepID=A0A4Q9M1R2_9MICR|nr:hypothetical protein LUQ84_000684 [Hamiltosporidium tvaerminnensis]TBU20674.1 hypothetical protein CWI38_0036p0030 [Hamiltosporidium tvaerminnensis]